MSNQRRHRHDLWNDAEKAIYEAMQEVEKLGADEKLTEAVILLSKAHDLVSEYMESVPETAKDDGPGTLPPPPPPPPPGT